MTLVPLESNPDVMTKFIHQLGVPTKWSVVDVYGLDPDVLAIVPQPTLALILLYPHHEKAKAYNAELVAKITEQGQKVSPNVFHMKQCVSNACGTMALIHAIGNNVDEIDLQDGSLKMFLDSTVGLSFEEKGKLFIDTAHDIIDAHEKLAQEGQTAVPQKDDPVYHHFVTFIEKDGSLYEVDGCKPFPINYGPTTKDTLLENAAKICGEYMARDPDEHGFTMIALAAANE